ASAEAPRTSIGEAVTQSTDHSTLLSAVKAAGLEATLTGSQPYTLFAPTNAAFTALGAGAQELMQPSQKGQLTAVLTNHIVPGTVTAADLAAALERGKGRAELATVGGGTLTFAKNGDAITIADGRGGQARIGGADMMQSNGVVHSIDAVLTPAAASAPAAAAQ
ncbi:MAG: fasciclin domain-containing protein, partial [Pseudomonadota bacterium]|nr:fasciclin domain-containing protein [Pseudomonadota bacterium]